MTSQTKIDVVNGMDLLQAFTRKLCEINSIEYKERMVLGNLSYDNKVAIDNHRTYECSITHDGTLLFLYDKLDHMLWKFATQCIVPVEFKDKWDTSQEINYIIGDVVIENEYNVKTDKSFPMMKQTIKIPYEVTVNGDSLRTVFKQTK